MKILWCALALCAVTTPALAQDACPSAAALSAGTSASDAPALKAGETIALTLTPAPQIHFGVPAHRGDDPATRGGIATLDVAQDGVWRISLGSAAWINVAQTGAEVPSSAHQHGTGCIAKMVDFPLKRGKATIEISAASETPIRIAAAPAGG